jgi:peptide/nickel transport system substrate-binding protein
MQGDMKHFGLLSLVAASLFVTAVAPGSTRPHYGGTLRVVVRNAPSSLDPVDPSQQDSLITRSVSRLIFDTLVILDERGRTQAGLATFWQAQPGNQRWQFTIRRGVSFHDGTAVSPDAVAASLRTANPNWKVFATGEAVVIECDVPTPNLPAILALTRYGIAKRVGGKLTGSGPFVISGWDPGKKLALRARDDYWGGRAFVDAVEVEMGKSFREQMIALDLGKADVIEVAPDQARRAAAEGRRIENSAPEEWMGLVFSRDPRSDDSQSGYEKKLRQALALSIDRNSMNMVLLQGAGEPAGTFLPDWMTGYAFLFPTGLDMQRAQLTRGEVPQAPVWALGYAASGDDTSDALGRVITERIALNARDAGLRLQTVNSGAAEVRLVRVPLASLDAQVALSSLAAKLGLPLPKFDGDPAAGLFAAENALLQSQRVIPLLHLRTAIALGANVRGWTEDRDGGWQLQNVWLGTEKP